MKNFEQQFNFEECPQKEEEGGLKLEENTMPEKEIKIKDYINKTLTNEERIDIPMSPECKASIIVPVFGERDYIFRPLKSLAQQQGIKSEEFEAIFIINNPPPIPNKEELTENEYLKIEQYEKILKENQETLKIFKLINGENVQVELSEEEKNIIADIKEKGIKIHCIDKSSKGKELSVANVGGARNRGVAEAVARFYENRNNGIIGQTDADSRMEEHYIRRLIDIFHDKPELIGVTGEMQFEESEDNDELFKLSSIYYDLEYFYSDLLRMVSEGKISKDEVVIKKEVPFTGANMASRAYETALVDGIPEFAGGEDTEFGKRLEKIGKIEKAREIKTYPSDRFSARTDEKAGHGHRKLKYAQALEKNGRVEVKSVGYTMINKSIRDNLAEAIRDNKKDVDSLKEVFSIDGESIFNENELVALSVKLETVDDASKINSNKLLDELREKYYKILESKEPSRAIEEAITELLEELNKNDILKKTFEIVKTDLIQKDEDSVKRGVEIIDKLLCEIYPNKSKDINDKNLLEIIKEKKDEIGANEKFIAGLESNSIPLKKIAEQINLSNSKDEAMNKLKTIFKYELMSTKEYGLKMKIIEVKAMKQATRKMAQANI